MNKLIEVIRLSKVYQNGSKSTAALEDINLTVNHGEYLAIAGPSGAGKSTLIHIMGGLDSASGGKVLFKDKPLSSLGESGLSLWRNKTIGFVFQFYHLIEELTVLENVALPSLLSKQSRKSSFKKAQGLLEYLGIEGKSENMPSQLSGGEQQKAAIARALINDPEVIFCDEPTGNLDKSSQDVAINLLESLNSEKKKTVIIVTHNRELAERTGRIICINGGRLEEEKQNPKP